MQIEIIVITAFVMLTIGRLAWEVLIGRDKPEITDAEAAEFWDAIR